MPAFRAKSDALSTLALLTSAAGIAMTGSAHAQDEEKPVLTVYTYDRPVADAISSFRGWKTASRSSIG